MNRQLLAMRHLNRFAFCLMLLPGLFSAEEIAFGRDKPALSSQTFQAEGDTLILASGTYTAVAPSYPTFNSELLDRQLALYQQYVATSGPPDILIVGSSRALQGVDPVALQTALASQGYAKLKVFNFGVNGATAQVVDVLLRKILTPQQLPRMIVWADGVRAFNSGRVDRTYNAILASPGYQRLSGGSRPSVSPPTRPSSIPATRPSSAPGGGIIRPDPINFRQEVPQSPGHTIRRKSSSRLQKLSFKSFKSSAADSKIRPILGAHYQAQLWDENQQQPLAEVYYQQRTIPSRGSGPSWPPAQQRTRTAPAAQPARSPESERIGSGFNAVSTRFNPATYYERVRRVPGEYDGDYASFNLQGQQAAALQSVVAFVKSKRIPLVIVNLPLTQDYLDSVRLRHEREFQQFMQRFAGERGFIFRDLSSRWPAQHDYFADPSHLNVYGAEAVSKQLGQDRTIPWPTSKP
ncbi:hypothetical protein [Microcoleus sp. FACHB-672]|uniref:hypothetical protein n=1 Tax=Microcoleus sp. FACHB-672 TaxID=2692825 RepID=UPI001689BBC3|nr:hypothetical protein [Microcoleus sp. FACHB-672]MBD2040125.1 hypothetical protein [Microcoleus sp. FACHB-672]